jgi:hypothetical protein
MYTAGITIPVSTDGNRSKIEWNVMNSAWLMMNAKDDQKK